MMSSLPLNLELSKALQSIKLLDEEEDEDRTLLKQITVETLEALIRDIQKDRIGGIAFLVFPLDEKKELNGALNMALMRNEEIPTLLGALQNFLNNMSFEFIRRIHSPSKPQGDPN